MLVASGVAEEADGVGDGRVVREDPRAEGEAPAFPLGEERGEGGGSFRMRTGLGEGLVLLAEEVVEGFVEPPDEGAAFVGDGGGEEGGESAGTGEEVGRDGAEPLEVVGEEGRVDGREGGAAQEGEAFAGFGGDERHADAVGERDFVGSGSDEVAAVADVFGEAVAEGALRERRPEHALDRGADDQRERDADEDADDVLEWHRDLRVESDGAGDEQHGDLVGQRNAGAEWETSAPENERGEEEDEQDGVVGKEWGEGE